MEIDWAELWRKHYKNYFRTKEDSKKFWDSFAERYAENVLKRQKMIEKKVEELKNILELNRETTILEIGPGAGTYTIPLAKIVKEITVVEQSTGMINVLKKRMKEEGIDNINIINKRWEDVELYKDFDEHDVVFSSYSLGVEDMYEALKKMHETARRYCCILTFGDRAGWRGIYDKIREILYGDERKSFNLTYIYIYNILYQMGITANVKITKKPFVQEFKSLDEAVNHYLRRFREIDGIEPTEEQLEKIKDILRNKLTKTENGWKFERIIKEAMIWWEKLRIKFLYILNKKVK